MLKNDQYEIVVTEPAPAVLAESLEHGDRQRQEREALLQPVEPFQGAFHVWECPFDEVAMRTF